MTKTGVRRMHGIQYYSHGYIPLKCVGNVVMRIGTQQLRQVCKASCSTLEMDSIAFSLSGGFLTKFRQRLLRSLSAQPQLCVKELKKIIARTLCFMRRINLKPGYVLITMLIVLDFCAQNHPLILFNLNPFNIKKSSILGF